MENDHRQSLQPPIGVVPLTGQFNRGHDVVREVAAV
jgi:hypothetical protein